MLFKHLFTPHEIRGLEIRNRIYSSAHQTILAEKGAPGEKMAAYHDTFKIFVFMLERFNSGKGNTEDYHGIKRNSTENKM